MVPTRLRGGHPPSAGFLQLLQHRTAGPVPETAEVTLLHVWRPEGQRCQRGPAPPKSSWGRVPPASHRRSLAGGCLAPVSASTCISPSLPCLSSSSHKDARHWIQVHLVNSGRSQIEILHFTTPATTLSPNKVTLTGAGGSAVDISSWGPPPAPLHRSQW